MVGSRTTNSLLGQHPRCVLRCCLRAFDEAFDEGQADAEATLRAMNVAIDLHEHRKDVRQHLGGDPGARILDGYQGLAFIGFEADSDLAARLGILGGVVQQVGKDLCHANHVATDDHRLRWHADRELVTCLFDERQTRFDRFSNDRGQFQRLLRTSPVFPW